MPNERGFALIEVLVTCPSSRFWRAVAVLAASLPAFVVSAPSHSSGSPWADPAAAGKPKPADGANGSRRADREVLEALARMIDGGINGRR